MAASQEPEFDAFAANYTKQLDQCIRFSGQSSEFFHQVKVNALLHYSRQFMETSRGAVLDVGCGTGSLTKLIAPHFAEAHGSDISSQSIEIAKQHLPAARFVLSSESVLPYADNQFDLTFTSCVMHHVPPDNWCSYVAEMARVTKPGGLIAILEHNPWNPVTRYVVSNCVFDRDAILLSAKKSRSLLKAAGLDVIGIPYILFVPIKMPLIQRLEYFLRWIPLGAQYLALGQKRKS